MKIVREQREENNSLLRVTVGEEDYGQAVEKELREYKRKANIPGFRPGMGQFIPDRFFWARPRAESDE